VLLSDIEGQIQVLDGIFTAQVVVVDEIWSVAMNQGAEGQAVLEAHVEVLDVDVLVWLGLTLTP